METQAAPHTSLVSHIPVLLQRCVDLLAPALSQPGAVLIDGTLGLGGHSEAILAQLPHVQVIGIDRDRQAIETATRRLAVFQDRFQAVHSTYDRIVEVMQQAGFTQVAGVLLDLGVSSMQLDDYARGFSYSKDAPLDMRMDQSVGQTAADIVNSYGEAELRSIIFEYGEDKFASRIARAIVAARNVAVINSTAKLAQIVDNAIPWKAKKTGGHPAKRTFQALRIEVNQELTCLAATIPQAISCLGVGGRIVVESYHSLEDRMVKREFAKGFAENTPLGLPTALPEHLPYLRPLTRGAEKADQPERDNNSRSTSVRLRAAERIRQTNILPVSQTSQNLLSGYQRS